MKRFIAPAKLGVHRTAGISLFRALLFQCRSLEADAQLKNELANIIRQKFSRNRHVASLRLLGNAFEAGYKALDLLDDAQAGSDEAMISLRDLVSKTPQHLKCRPAIAPVNPFPKRKGRPVSALLPSQSIYARPLPVVVGRRRRIPTLFSANDQPVLRYGKPQTPLLGPFLRKRAKARQWRHNMRGFLEDNMIIAKLEDNWETMMDQEVASLDIGEPETTSDASGPNSTSEETTSYSSSYALSLKHLSNLLQKETEDNLERVRRYEKIIRQETKLKAKEDAELDAQRRRQS